MADGKEGLGELVLPTETSRVREERLQKAVPLLFGNSNCTKEKAELDGGGKEQ